MSAYARVNWDAMGGASTRTVWKRYCCESCASNDGMLDDETSAELPWKVARNDYSCDYCNFKIPRKTRHLAFGVKTAFWQQVEGHFGRNQ